MRSSFNLLRSAAASSFTFLLRASLSLFIWSEIISPNGRPSKSPASPIFLRRLFPAVSSSDILTVPFSASASLFLCNSSSVGSKGRAPASYDFFSNAWLRKASAPLMASSFFVCCSGVSAGIASACASLSSAKAFRLLRLIRLAAADVVLVAVWMPATGKAINAISFNSSGLPSRPEETAAPPAISIGRASFFIAGLILGTYFAGSPMAPIAPIAAPVNAPLPPCLSAVGISSCLRRDLVNSVPPIARVGDANFPPAGPAKRPGAPYTIYEGRSPST